MRIFILCSLFILALSRPKQAEDEEDRSRLVGTEDKCSGVKPYAEPDSTGITRFKFCWNEPGRDADKGTSEEGARAWERVANLSMEFLPSCDDRDADTIPIYIMDVRPYVMPAYVDCKYKASQMVLNFDFGAAGYQMCQNPGQRNDCIKFLAMHEVGHAIGFNHEQDHPDSTCDWDRDYGVFNLETEYDPHSIMNYCNGNVWEDPHLSDLDIKGVQKVFGKRRHAEEESSEER